MQSNSRRWQLRQRTAVAHGVVDAAVGGFSGSGEYRRYLEASYAFRAPLERQILQGEWPFWLEPWRPGAVTAALCEDLADLDIAVPETMAPQGTVADLLGTLYVLEGSSLGAKVLLRRATALGYSPDFGARHLAVQSADPERWRGFLAALEAAQPFDIERAVAASLAAFDAAASAYQGSPS